MNPEFPDPATIIRKVLLDNYFALLYNILLIVIMFTMKRGGGHCEAEDLFEGGFVGGLEGASVDEKRGSAFDFERFALGDVGFDGGLGGGIGHAGVERVGGRSGSDGVSGEHVPGVVGRDGGLIGENGVLKF